MYLAQFNISNAKFELDDPRIQEFINSLSEVNKLADVSDGFVWRLHDSSGNAIAIKVFDNPRIIFNLSVWKSIETLKNFVYKSHHADILKRRKEWFHLIEEQSYVLWLVEEGKTPTLEEAKAKLQHIQKHGASPNAFTFREPHFASCCNAST